MRKMNPVTFRRKSLTDQNIEPEKILQVNSLEQAIR